MDAFIQGFTIGAAVTVLAILLKIRKGWIFYAFVITGAIIVSGIIGFLKRLS